MTRRSVAIERVAWPTALLGLFGVALAAAPSPADAQFGRMIGNVNRAVVGSVTDAARASFRIRPRLGIVRGEAGPVVGLRRNDGGGLLFVVLGDGSARLWDLERGVQLGGAISGDVVAGTVRGGGGAWEAIAVRRDGSSISIRPDGRIRAKSEAIAGLDRNVAPILSADGSALAYRIAGEGWGLAIQDGRTLQLATRPILSRDGARAYPLFGCGETAARATAGAFAPGGRRIAFGDEEGSLCVWEIPEEGQPRRLFLRRGAHSGPIRALAFDRSGEQVVTGGADGKAELWSVTAGIDRVASLDLGDAASGPLLLDAERGWVFAGERSGTVGIHSIEEKKRIARLISTDDGWAVLDREGRFDGPQNGLESLVWAGETAARTFPVGAFSESYFEPGLLTKLDRPAQRFLNEGIDDLSEGYVRPPAVSIDPIDAGSPGERLPVMVRVESGYPRDAVSDIRLYHNGKLVGQDPRDAPDGAVEYGISPLPGENTFTAVGVGPGGIEGRADSTTVTFAAGEPRRAGMRVVTVGINDYVRPAWELLHARNDAKAIVATLRERAGSLFDGVDAVTLLDSSASSSAIEDQILRRAASHRDVLVVYLSGHGYALREGKGWEWYFLPFSDAWGKRGTATKDKIRQHGLSSRRLMEMLTEAEARRVFLVLDSCRSGAVIDSVLASRGRAFDDAAGQKALHRIARVGGIHVLAAARANEDAVELISEPHGALTYLMLEGMQGQADGNRDGTVSVKEIISYADRAMPLLSRRLGENVSHKPVGYSRGADFALAGTQAARPRGGMQ